MEEQLLAALLSANEQLTEALKMYEDLERIKMERDVEERSRKETKMNYRDRVRVSDICLHCQGMQLLTFSNSNNPATTPQQQFRQFHSSGQQSYPLSSWPSCFTEPLTIAIATALCHRHTLHA